MSFSSRNVHPKITFTCVTISILLLMSSILIAVFVNVFGGIILAVLVVIADSGMLLYFFRPMKNLSFANLRPITFTFVIITILFIVISILCTLVSPIFGIIVGVILGGLILVVGSGLLLYFLQKRGVRREYEGNNTISAELTEVERGNGPKKFSYTDLVRATRNFSEEEKLGQGGFAGVYKGYIEENNTYLAVKKISKGSNQGLKEYVSEVKIISRLRHRNLVQLLGWCHETSELLLVYKYMRNGSLDHHLFKERSLLTWDIRFKIAQGLASALLYLHEEWEQCVLHRDIKSSNVMLDSSFNTNLGDFGLARLVDHENGLQTTVLAGTMGYMAPEITITGKASKETDIYSFGVVALEIACGRKPIERRAPEGEEYLVGWVWSLYGTGKLLEVADPKLSLVFNEKELECLMLVGLWCAHPDYNARPSIKQANRVLIFEAPLPELPLRMPVPTYAIPLVTSSVSHPDVQVSEISQVMTLISGRT